MKFATAFTLFSLLLPSGSTGAETKLRGVGQELESFLSASTPEVQHRELDQCLDDPLYLGGNTGDATCCMPLAIDETFLTSGSSIDVSVKTSVQEDGGGSYLEFTFGPDGGPFANLEDIEAWCIDLSRNIGSKVFPMLPTNSYDDINYDEAMDNPQRLPNLNWMLNAYTTGDEIFIPPNFPATECQGDFVAGNQSITWTSYQNAIWSLMDSGMTEDGIFRWPTGNDCVTAWMVSEALANGDGFVPDCYDENAQIAVVMIIPRDGTENDIKNQVTIAVLDLKDFPGICQPKECCEELTVNHETFVGNIEINATYTKGESNTAAWAVSFTAGSAAISGDLAALGQMDAWSVDRERDILGITESGDYSVDTYSVYDNWYRFNAVDKKENLPKVNYLINTYPVGTIVDGSDVTIEELQEVIWYLMDFSGVMPTSTIGTFLVGEANANGVGYEPSCAAGVEENIALLLIVDDGDEAKLKAAGIGLGKQYDVNQVSLSITEELLIVSVPLEGVSGSCFDQDCQCCEIPTPTPAPFTFPPIPSPTSPSDPRDDPTNGAPVEEISTPAPVPDRPPVAECDDQIDILGSNLAGECGTKGVGVVASTPSTFDSSVGDNPPPLRIDILDTFFGITITDGNTVSFRAQNPFDGGSVDMYVQYENAARETVCDSQPGVDECDPLNGGTVIEAICMGQNDDLVDNMAVVDVFFVESGGSLFDVTHTGNVPACCEPDETNTGAVISYTFFIMCECPAQVA